MQANVALPFFGLHKAIDSNLCKTLIVDRYLGRLRRVSHFDKR